MTLHDLLTDAAVKERIIIKLLEYNRCHNTASFTLDLIVNELLKIAEERGVK